MAILRRLGESIRYRVYRLLGLPSTRFVSLFQLISLKRMKMRYALPPVDLAAIVDSDVTIEPPIIDDCFLPPYHGSKIRHDDFTPLMKIAKGLQPDVVLEFGTAYGNVAANICRQCPKAQVYTVNALPNDIHQVGIYTIEPSKDEIGRVYRAYGYQDRVVQIYSDTKVIDFSQFIDSPAIGLAIVDANHETSYVINDFFKLLPLLRKGGVVLFHDTHPSMSKHLVGSYAACMELRKQGYDIKHINGTWWGLYTHMS